MGPTESSQVDGDQPGSSKKTTWEILNAPFVLFLMTSVVLGGLSFSYQEYATYRKKIEDRNTRISHLKTEIKYRMDTAASMLKPQFTFTIMFTTHGALLGSVGNTSPEGVLTGEYTAIYPEFEGRNAISLLWELQELERRTIKTFSLEKSIEAAHRMAVIWDEDLESVHGLVIGKHDSIWRFAKQPSEDEFQNDIRLIRDSIATDDL